MRAAHVTRRQAEALLDGFDTDDVLPVQAVQQEIAMWREREQLRESAEVDRLLLEAEHKLASEQKIVAGQHTFGWRSSRRSRQPERHRPETVTLRKLPPREVSTDPLDSDGRAA